MQRFPEKLRALRKRNGVTRQKLAEQLGLSDVHIYYLEMGKRNPSAELVFRIARFFHVTTDQLLDDEMEV